MFAGIEFSGSRWFSAFFCDGKMPPVRICAGALPASAEMPCEVLDDLKPPTLRYEFDVTLHP